MRKYEEGYVLKDNEYLLKIRKSETEAPDTGFMTRMNKDGSMPVAFSGWGISRWSSEEGDLQIYIIEETFRSGWKICGWRFGKSRNWTIMTHPLGFTVEIHLNYYGEHTFLNLIKENTIINGEIQGSFKWEPHKLIQEK